jgi:hypothetical protein
MSYRERLTNAAATLPEPLLLKMWNFLNSIAAVDENGNIKSVQKENFRERPPWENLDMNKEDWEEMENEIREARIEMHKKGLC